MSGIIALLIMLLFTGGFIYLFYYTLIVVPRRLKLAYSQFAANHGLQFDPVATAVGYQGILKGQAGYLLYGTDNKFQKPIKLFRLTYVVGSGKNRHEYDRTVAEITINPTNSHVFVNSLVNDTGEQLALDRHLRYKAEGDFGKYFDIYAVDSQRLEALALFSPDALDLIMGDYGFYDIEVINDKMYLYQYNYANTVNDLETFYSHAIRMATELNTNSPRVLKLEQQNGEPEPSAVTSLNGKFSGFGNPWLWIPIVFLGPILFFAAAANNKLASYLPAIIQPLFFVFAIGLFIKRAHKKHEYERARREFRQQALPGQSPAAQPNVTSSPSSPTTPTK